jgi:PIN domain nuclease of toxin-antitoxin system
MNVFDSSAIIAYLDREAGAEEISHYVESSLISTVNLAEVLQKAEHRGMPRGSVRALIENAGIGIVPFDDEMATASAELWDATRRRGLSLADRACLALTAAVSGLAVTTDTAWGGLDIEGVDIHVVRR